MSGLDGSVFTVGDKDGLGELDYQIQTRTVEKDDEMSEEEKLELKEEELYD